MQPETNLSPKNNEATAETSVGQKLRAIRTGKGFSLKSLAERSGLNINTLSLVENGKSSPSVSTLQQIALALDVPITAFFEAEPVKRRVVFTPGDRRPQTFIRNARMQNLGKDLVGNKVQPFIVLLPPGGGSGDREIVHTGHEFVYCLRGRLRYRIEQEEVLLHPGDSLLFEAHLPHCWKNEDPEEAEILLILYPADEREEFGGRHFS